MDYMGIAVKAAASIGIVMVLVEAAKKLGLAGVWLTRASFLIGLAFGLLTEAATGFQSTLLWWVSASIYGLLLGAGACGAYDLIQNKRTAKPPKPPNQSGEVLYG
jgi:hypothetical protein